MLHIVPVSGLKTVAYQYGHGIMALGGLNLAPSGHYCIPHHKIGIAQFEKIVNIGLREVQDWNDRQATPASRAVWNMCLTVAISTVPHLKKSESNARNIICIYFGNADSQTHYFY